MMIRLIILNRKPSTNHKTPLRPLLLAMKAQAIPITTAITNPRMNSNAHLLYANYTTTP